MFKHKVIILLLFLVLVFTRLFRLDQPETYYFDEVYHAFTATEMAKGNPQAWEWWNMAPAGFAYEWTHPPLSKLFMATGVLILGEHSYAWRLPGAVVGIGLGILLYLLVKKVINPKAAVLTLFIYTFDGMALVMSRIGMNDIYLMFFIILCLTMCVYRRMALAALMFGLAIATKWSAIYFSPVLLLFLWKEKRLQYVLLLPLVYLLGYTPFFLMGHELSQFVELQKQMWWYHTGLKATHSYSSPAISWPLILRPVWTYVQYLPDAIANVYIQGNPLVLWSGIGAVAYAVWRRKWLLFVSGFMLFWLPWIVSPRIMFLYHYFPSVIFLYVLLAALLAELKNKYVLALALASIFIAFVYFFPHWTAIPVPTAWANQYYWLRSWR